MRYFMPDSSEPTGNDASQRPLETRPTGMETDPQADGEIIRQTGDSSAQNDYPEPVQPADKSARIAPDNLADSIAYALDGSGPGPTNAKPSVPEHSVITEGTTGSGVGEEERITE